ETHRLVRELADLTGQSQTSAVEDAVRRRLAELRRDDDRQRRYQRIRKIADEMHEIALADPVWMNTDWDDEMYDEIGLP
ncbi:type II toxin-antitoxin system VapB family antitoxin, partial [Pseudomonas aeruginosa]|uniref:type II toxin-antitoxin system VapB family antitoxin n=1 Tax=Pseudomonas aeruginosa TaxID=287 RepID=UPI003458104A